MSSIALPKLDHNLDFPAVREALNQPNGLLAFGGDLSVERLVRAYQQGIFPWFSHGEPILWWSPDPRGVLFVEQYAASKSLKKFMRKTPYSVTLNRDFAVVIEHCASIKRADSGTWITAPMVDAYKNLHQAGYAHSVEVWQAQKLIGGLYGVFVNRVFCGESMFSLSDNASKIAFHHLVGFLRHHQVKLIDCQMQNPHLQRLGCQTLAREQFIQLLGSNPPGQPEIDWRTQVLSQS